MSLPTKLTQSREETQETARPCVWEEEGKPEPQESQQAPRQRVSESAEEIIEAKLQQFREDFARKTANTLVTSHDLIAYEDLQIRNMVRNHHLAKSIHDAGWGQFITWVKAYGTMHHIPVIAVAPQFTSQQCCACGTMVKKSLSVRTHICHGCGMALDRDHNAARVTRN